MALFLVTGKIRSVPYMSDNDDICDEIQLVEAEDAASAIEMFERFWTAHTSEYSVYYYATAVSCKPVLTKEMVTAKVAAKR